MLLGTLISFELSFLVTVCIGYTCTGQCLNESLKLKKKILYSFNERKCQDVADGFQIKISGRIPGPLCETGLLRDLDNQRVTFRPGVR